MAYSTTAACPIAAIPLAYLLFLSILASVKHSSVPKCLSLPASPICPSLCPVFPRCLGLTAVLSSTSYCRVMLPASLNTGKIPIICLWPLLLPPFSSHPVVRSLRSCLHPKGVLAAPKLQLQRRIGAAVIP